MKIHLFIYLFVCLNTYSQEDNKIIFIFENDKDTFIKSQNDYIYKIDGKHTFKFVDGKHEKIEVNYNSVKENIVTFNQFIKQNKNKKYPELFNDFTFYILVKENDSSACLIQVEKVWLVENKIID